MITFSPEVPPTPLCQGLSLTLCRPLLPERTALGGGPGHDPADSAGAPGGDVVVPVATAEEEPGPVQGEGEGASRERSISGTGAARAICQR